MVKIVPWVGVANRQVGGMPVGSVLGKLVNGLVAAGQLIYGGLMAIGNFFVQLGEAIVNWGMRALGVIANALHQAKSALESARQILGTLMDCVLNWFMGAAPGMLVRPLGQAKGKVPDGDAFPKPRRPPGRAPRERDRPLSSRGPPG